MEAMELSITPELERVWKEREETYNAYLASLDSWELHALFRGHAPGKPDESLESSVQELFVAGVINLDFIAREILSLLGEI